MNNSEVLLNEEHQPTGTGSVGEQDLKADDEKLLKDLIREWQRYQQRGLVTRHRMGSLLNDRFGPPDQRQPRGAEVMKLAAERLHTSVSELSRMRWFAHHFEDHEDLKNEHPEVRSWTQLKKLLPSLKPEDEQEETASPELQGSEEAEPSRQPEGARKKRRPGRVPSPTNLREATKSLQKVSSKLKLVQQPAEAERKKFLEKLQGFAEVVLRLGIRMSVELVRGDESNAA